MAPPETRETRGAAHGHSTVLFGLVGQASDYTLAKVTFTGDSAAGHASLVTIAAERRSAAPLMPWHPTCMLRILHYGAL